METEKTVQRRCFGFYFMETFVQGDVSVKMIRGDDSISHRQDVFFLIDGVPYDRIELLEPIFLKENMDGFVKKLERFVN